MKLFQQFASLPVLLLLLTGNALCYAADVLGSSHFRISGFGTLALTQSGDEDLGFRGELSQEGLFDEDWSLRSDSLLGLQLDFLATEQLSGAIQLVGKDRVDNSFENSLEWAFLHYRLGSDWSLRAGRMGSDIYMLSDYRNVGFAYLWSRPPMEFYTPLPSSRFDGADLAWSTPLGEGTLRAKLMVGTSKAVITVLDSLVDVELKEIVGGTINWESERWQLRFSVSDNKLGEKEDFFPSTALLGYYFLQVVPFWPEAAAISDSLRIGDSHIRYYALGAAYNNAPWQLQSEISYFDSEMDIYPPSSSGYVSVGYQIGAFTPFVVAAFINSERERRSVPEPPAFPTVPGLTEQLILLQQAAQLAFDSSPADQHTLSLGARWDIRYDMAVKAQWDHTQVSAYSAGLWDQRSVTGKTKELDTLSINLNFIF